VETYKGYNLVSLDENEPLLPGDRILIRFKWITSGTTSRAMQLAAIERNLERHENWQIVSYTNLEDFLDAEIEIISVPKIDPSSGITQASLGAGAVVVLTAALIAASIAIYSLTKIYQWKLESEGKISPKRSSFAEIASGLHVGIYVAIAIGLLFVLKRLAGNSKGRSRSDRNGYS